MVSLNVEHQLIWSSLKTRRIDASPPLQDQLAHFWPKPAHQRTLSEAFAESKGGKEAAPKPYMLPTLAMTL